MASVLKNVLRSHSPDGVSRSGSKEISRAGSKDTTQTTRTTASNVDGAGTRLARGASDAVNSVAGVGGAAIGTAKNAGRKALDQGRKVVNVAVDTASYAGSSVSSVGQKAIEKGNKAVDVVVNTGRAGTNFVGITGQTETQLPAKLPAEPVEPQKEDIKWADSVMRFRGKKAKTNAVATMGIQVDKIDRLIQQRSDDEKNTHRAYRRLPTVALSRTVTPPNASTPIEGLGDILEERCHSYGIPTQRSCKTIQDLLDQGHTMDEVIVALYEVMNSSETPNFFPHVELDTNGGLNDIDEIWDSQGTPQRRFWCAFLFVSVAFNISSLLMTNVPIFRSCIKFAQEDGVEVFSNVSHHVEQSKLRSQVELIGDKATSDIFRHISDQETKLAILSAALGVAIIEVLWIASRVPLIISQIAIFSCSNDGDPREECRSYQSLHQLFLETLPTMSTFSAMKLLFYVHPTFIYSFYIERITYSQFSRSSFGFVVVTIAFTIERIMCLAVALLAFGVKALTVGFRLIDHHLSWWLRCMGLAALMIQCVGCVHLEKALRERVSLFVFGGADAAFQSDELALLRVYWTRLSKKIWCDYWKRGERLKAVAMLSTLDHYDFQALLLNATGSELDMNSGQTLRNELDVNSDQTFNKRSASM